MGRVLGDAAHAPYRGQEEIGLTTIGRHARDEIQDLWCRRNPQRQGFVSLRNAPRFVDRECTISLSDTLQSLRHWLAE
jgi:hypothetical protein